jgi:hypothetical protein
MIKMVINLIFCIFMFYGYVLEIQTLCNKTCRCETDFDDVIVKCAGAAIEAIPANLPTNTSKL